MGTKADVRTHVVEFVSENEGILSAYAVDGIDRRASPRSDQQSLPGVLSPDQGASFLSYPSHEDSRPVHQIKLADLKEPMANAVTLGPILPTNLHEPDKCRQRPIYQVDQKRREKVPELKFQTFQRIPDFDAFRPLPRLHFSSDAMSDWPLRSIEESRLLQHFIQNLAAWVCLRTRLTNSTVLILRAVRRW